MDFSHLQIKPVRFIPFDLGDSLSQKDTDKICDYLDNKHMLKQLDDRSKMILTKQPIVASLNGMNDKLDLYLFDTGIGVFVLKDNPMNYKEDIRFVVDFLRDRRNCHRSILEGKYPVSLAIHKVMSELKEVLAKPKKRVRVSSLPDWEYDGLSYVMSIHFGYPSQLKSESLTFTHLPAYLQKGIPIILNPAYLGMNDSLSLDEDKVMKDPDQLSKLLDEMDEEPLDYETRKDILAFMSWASVFVTGNINQLDMEDWILLEVELQHYWYYLYCLESSLPTTLKGVQKSDFTMEQLLIIKLETQRAIEDVQHINGSSIPERYTRILDGLVHSSRILSNANRLLNKLSYWEDALKAKQEKRKHVFIQTSEILIFSVAYLQIAPDLYKYFSNPTPLSITALVKTAGLFAVTVCVIIIKNRYR
jgi:hypothetical protein